VTIEAVDGELRVRSFRETLARIQARFCENMPPGVTPGSIIDEFIAERRAEAERE
jgi:hypothetical protein